ncbi:hypothetical protein CCP3SC1_1120007 [Gammaproteobacteria bacterium]
MQAIEFEAIPQHHSIQIPKEIPDGTCFRVLLLWEPDKKSKDNFHPKHKNLMDLYGSNGLSLDYDYKKVRGGEG